jgi:carbamate kinase
MKQTNMKYTDNEMKGVKSYYDAAIMVAEKVKADLIMVLTTKDIQLQDYMMGAEEQKIIVNASKIPVMCINPMQVHAYSVGALMR